jgi:hypothetical protein
MKLFWYINCPDCGGDVEKSTDMDLAFEYRIFHHKITGHSLDRIWIYSNPEEGN